MCSWFNFAPSFMPPLLTPGKFHSAGVLFDSRQHLLELPAFRAAAIGQHIHAESRERIIGSAIFSRKMPQCLKMAFDDREIASAQGPRPCSPRADAFIILERLPRERHESAHGGFPGEPDAHQDAHRRLDHGENVSRGQSRRSMIYGLTAGGSTTGTPPSSLQTRRAARNAPTLPSIAKVEPASEGMVRPLNVCRGCSEPIAAPRSSSGMRASLPTALLVCRTIVSCHACLHE